MCSYIFWWKYQMFHCVKCVRFILIRIFPYSDQNNSEIGQFSGSGFLGWILRGNFNPRVGTLQMLEVILIQTRKLIIQIFEIIRTLLTLPGLDLFVRMVILVKKQGLITEYFCNYEQMTESLEVICVKPILTETRKTINYVSTIAFIHYFS